MSRVLDVSYAARVAVAPVSGAGTAGRIAWRQIAIFSLLAYLLSWTWFGIKLVPHLPGLLTAPTTPDDYTPIFGSTTWLAVGMFGPLVAAVIMRVFVSREGLRSSVRPWRSPRPYAFALAAFLAPGIYLALVVLVGQTSGLSVAAWPAGDPLTVLSPLLDALVKAGLLGGTISLIANVLFAYGEEYGWRGYLLPRLLPLGETRATLAAGAIWAAWHLPILLAGVNYPGQNVWLALAVFALVTLGLAFPFTCFFRAAGGSVIVTSVLHTSLNSHWDTVVPLVMPGSNPLAVGLAMGVVLSLLAGCVSILRSRPA
jgi:hypothetical protein